MDKAKRIVHVINKMNMGGAETFIMNIYRNIDRSKVQFDFIVQSNEEGYFDREIKSLGGRVIQISSPEKVGFKQYAIELKEALRKYGDFNAVHAHSHFFNGYILKVAKDAGVKVRVSHSHNSRDGEVQTFKRRVYRTLMRRLILSNATKMLSCSDKASEELYGKAKNKAIFIPNSVKFSLFTDTNLDLRKELNLNKNTQIIGHVGRFNDVKNHKYLIEIFKEINKKNKDTHLVMVGDGPLKNEMIKLVKEYSLENNAHFLGIRSDVPDIIQNFDLFIFPSKFEGLPVTLVEVQAAKVRALIADNITKDLLFTNGLIKYLPLDKFELWVNDAIELLKETDSYSKESISFLNTDFDVQTSVKKLNNIYFSK